jgi:hypothetical protein
MPSAPLMPSREESRKRKKKINQPSKNGLWQSNDLQLRQSQQ